MSEHKPPTGTAEAFSKMIEHEQKQPPAEKLYEYEHAIDMSTGQRTWEGEHRVVLIGKSPTWNTEILIDGVALQSDTERIEIDVDCKKPTPIVKLTRYARDKDGRLAVSGGELQRMTELLTANLLSITLEEARVVDVILNTARQEAASNAQAVQLFAISDTDEHGEQTTQVLATLLRDANRYRALQAHANTDRTSDDLILSTETDDARDLDRRCDRLVTEQAEQRRIKAER